MHIYPQKVQVFLFSNSNKFQTKNIYKVFTFVKILNDSPAQDLSNKKNAAFYVFYGLRYSSDNLLSFDTKRALLCAPTEDGKTSSLFVFSVVKESFSAQAAIVQNIEING
jgi:hypothetical protein